MKIYFASDHAGFERKKELMDFLYDKGMEVYDCGPREYNHEDDYPDYISIAAAEVSKDPENCKAIIMGFSGQGEAIVANRFPNVRCAVFYGGTKYIITLSREHNDSNMLSIGAHFVTTVEARQAVEMWLGTQFTNEERHVRRIEKIEKYN